MKNGSCADIGLDEKYLRRFMKRITEANVNLHSVILARGDTVFYESYTAPYTQDTPHRMYSVTKSYAGLAIGLLIDEGKLRLDDRIVDFFPDKCPADADPLLKMQTVRDMLQMRTCFAQQSCSSPEEMRDRVRGYLSQKARKYPGTLFDYDSAGSCVLGSLAERLSGKPLLTYLKEKLLDRIGGFENAEMLKLADGSAWASSALLCKPRGLLYTLRFLLNGGCWEGEQLLSRDFVEAATACRTFNDLEGSVRHNRCGYGYQIWGTCGGGFFFSGMCSQFAVAVPDKDLMLVCTADTQLHGADDQPRIFGALFEEIAAHLDGNEPDTDTFDLAAPRRLSAVQGLRQVPLSGKIDGREYIARTNTMGITRIAIDLTAGVLRWENAQGRKEMRFGMCENAEGLFPQLGYSDEIGFVHEITDFKYRCAASAAWMDANTLQMRVQIIDRYLGQLYITFGFRDENRVSVRMVKDAQDMLDEYNGWMMAESAT